MPLEPVPPGTIFENFGVDYAGPVFIKYGYVRNPTIVKAHICVFISLSVKAVHLELVSDLMSAALRCFISQKGYPKLIHTDHGTNFIGAICELKELSEFLKNYISQSKINEI